LIVQLKDNQPTLCCKVETVCNDAKSLSTVQTVEGKKRNRHETRIVAVFDARPAVRGTEWQPHVKAIIAVERRVLTFKPATGPWESSSECAFYLSNRPVLAGQAADAIRKHWGIENKQHYTRDVTF
jgi:predicted transposase YbfD/YdcC